MPRKTRIAQELAAHAGSLGVQIFWGWCHEQAGAPPYWPWVQPIRSYVQQADASVLGAQMGPGAADICEIIPEVREKLSDIEPAVPLELEQARFRLFNSIATFLTNVAQSQPLMLVLDDLQWADQPSLLFLEFFAQQVSDKKIMLLGTYRDIEIPRSHPLSNTLAQLTRSDFFHREALEGLESDDVERWIRGCTCDMSCITGPAYRDAANSYGLRSRRREPITGMLRDCRDAAMVCTQCCA